MFEHVRQSFREMLAGRIAPDDRRALVSQMKATLVQARVGLQELHDALAATAQRLEHEMRELDTVRRRRSLAEGINDAETVGIATKYEAQVAERVRILEQKRAAQEAELGMVSHEVEEMTAEFRRAAAGQDVALPSLDEAAAAEAERAVDDGAAGLRTELDALGRAQARARREAEADERLAALKRRMGK